MDLYPIAYNNINSKILHASNINPLTIEKTTYLIENNDSMNINALSMSNWVKSTKLAINEAFIVISLQNIASYLLLFTTKYWAATTYNYLHNLKRLSFL